ncbi:MAG TPA: hypothetical protein H9891_00250 [Candidatus Salinicoccus stercoripullorum]|uniref:Uncharacterized protein n=1 Tax=Candidatus Salinicoccus stercoripullorum TaxID=2838756 RepID=A0A9D1TZB5_9STAP|nr:hypothetical protein [Candidatus Salinicoccus stercoripullorum]
MKKLISVLIVSLMLFGAVTFTSPETVEASIVKSDEPAYSVMNGGPYMSDGRPRPIDVY